MDAWTWIKQHWVLLANILLAPFLPFVLLLEQVIKHIKTIENIGSAIGHFVGGIFSGGHAQNRGSKFSTRAQYRAGGGVVGGPAGTDTVPTWLTPGEGVLSRQAMNMIGERGLNMLNAGQSPFGGGQVTITPGVVNIQIDSKTIARAVVQYTLSKAARGPTSFSGGGLVTG